MTGTLSTKMFPMHYVKYKIICKKTNCFIEIGYFKINFKSAFIEKIIVNIKITMFIATYLFINKKFNCSY